MQFGLFTSLYLFVINLLGYKFSVTNTILTRNELLAMMKCVDIPLKKKFWAELVSKSFAEPQNVHVWPIIVSTRVKEIETAHLPISTITYF